MVVTLDFTTIYKIGLSKPLENLGEHISNGVGLTARKGPLNVKSDSVPERPIHMGRVNFSTSRTELP
jgi:hypothetical protein